MILQSLYNYYQILLKDHDAGHRPARLQHAANVSFALNLSYRENCWIFFPVYSKFRWERKNVERATAA